MSGSIQRIVVTLDAASENRAAIDTAVHLAAVTKAELHGVFIEDQDLLHLAGLPFAQQVTVGTGAEPLTSENLVLQLRAQAERAQNELLAAAKRHRVTCTFEIVRGASETAVAYASESGLVVAGGQSRPVAGHFRLERRWWSSIETVSGPLLLVRTAWTVPGSVVILLRDRDPASARLVETAAQITSARNGILTMICPPAIVDAPGFDQWVSDSVAQYRVRVQIELAPVESAALYERLEQLNCRLLALEAGLAEGSGDALRPLVERFACDMLIVP
jgi:nucleotide-binding universal stress UspA family protein